MAVKQADASQALVTVIKALEDLTTEDRLWVITSAASRWQIAANTAHFTATGGNANLGGTGSPSTPPASNIRAFIRQKAPETDVQRVACLVYFLTRTENKAGVTSKEISAAHVDSGGSKINMARALDNATRQSKYISSRGKKEKQMTTLGEDVVDALPNQEAVKALEGAAKGRGKARAKRKPRKKA